MVHVFKGKFGLLLAVSFAIFLGGCTRPGHELRRQGDEIVVCGRLFHTGGAPVVLWTDPGGYDAYRTEKRFVPWEKAAWAPPIDPKKPDGPASPNRYNVRFDGRGEGVNGGPALTAEELEQVRGGGWDLEMLQRRVDQFVIHYDVCGTSRQCFRILHDVRGLSVHFMLDLDGTIYQTLDLKERAWHATTSNDRSIGIEIANIGAYPPPPNADLGMRNAELPKPLDSWYEWDEWGPRVKLPESMGDGGVRTPGFVARPARAGPVVGEIQGQRLVMYDLTPRQYESLVKLTATLCRVFPNLPCDYPRDEKGELIREKLPDEELAQYRGVLGHLHIQKNKTDPGPAFDWERVVRGAKWKMGPE